MTYLKLVANAFWAGLYGALLIALLVFLLNEDLASSGRPLWSFASVLASAALVYVPILALLFPTLFACVRFFAARRLGISWFTLKAAVWFSAAVLGTMLGVYYHNLRWAVSIQSPAARDALRLAICVMGFCWLAAVGCGACGQFATTAPGRRWRLAASALLALPAVVTALAIARLPGTTGPRPTPEIAGDRVIARGPAGGRALVVVGLVGGSMDDLLPLVSTRELPQFERLLKEGASARLDTIAPCVSNAAWTTLATGMPPWATGVKDTRAYELAPIPGLAQSGAIGVLPRSLGMGMLLRAGLVRSRPIPAAASSRPPFWEILKAAGASVETSGWPGHGDEPPPAVSLDDPRVASRVERILGAAPGQEGAGGEIAPALRDVVRRAVAEDLEVRDVSMARWGARDGVRPRVVASLFHGPGAVLRHFLRFHRPADYGDVTAQESARFGKVVSRYYAFLDELVAEQVEAAGPLACVMVVSAHGVEPLSGWERLTRMIFPPRDAAAATTGSWRRGPDGLLMVRGEGVVAGARIEDADIEDVLPTLLYLLGLPVERELHGTLLRRLFTRAYLETHPVQLVHGLAGPAPRR